MIVYTMNGSIRFIVYINGVIIGATKINLRLSSCFSKIVQSGETHGDIAEKCIVFIQP